MLEYKENIMTTQRNPIFDAKILFAVAIILLGLLALLDNIGIDIEFNFWKYWPVILILVGAGQLLQPREYRQYFSGLFFLAAGILLLANNLIEEFYFSIWELWPLLLVFFGGKLLSDAIWGSGKAKVGKDFVSLTAILGGGDFKFTSRNLQGGQITAFLGGCKADLRDADFSGEQLIIDVTAFMGGAEIIVPRHWRVTMQGVPILGGMDNKADYEPEITGQQSSVEKNLVVKGVVMFGGVEVKN
jgi:predicted membrane protein